MRAAVVMGLASALLGCNAALDLGGNDDPADGDGGGGAGSGSVVTSVTSGAGGDTSATGSVGGATPSTSATSAGGDEGGGGSGGGGGGGLPLGPCTVPDGAIVLEPGFESLAGPTESFAVGDERIAIAVQTEIGPSWTTLHRLDRATLTPLDDGVQIEGMELAFAGDVLFGVDFCGPWRESGDSRTSLLPSCTAEPVYSIASDGTTVVFGEMDRLWATPADGTGAPTLLFEHEQPGTVDAIFYDALIDGPVAYVAAPAYSETEALAGPGSVWRVALDGSFRQLVGETPTGWNAQVARFGPTRVAVDDTHVYWNDVAEGQVYRADEEFGEPEVVFDVDAPVDLAIVGADLIVAEAPLDCRGTILHRFAGGSGEPTTFAVVDERVTLEGSGDELFLASAWSPESTGARLYRVEP